MASGNVAHFQANYLTLGVLAAFLICGPGIQSQPCANGLFISDIETELWVVEMMHFDAFCSLPAIFNPAHIFQQLSWYACCCYSCSWDKVPLCSASWSISTHRGCLQCCYFWAFGWCWHVSSHSGSVLSHLAEPCCQAYYISRGGLDTEWKPLILGVEAPGLKIFGGL